MKITRILYWVFTIATCALFLYSAQMYFFNTEMVKGFFEQMSFPNWLVIPLAVAKVLGVVAVLTNYKKTLTEWAYAGFLFDVILATGAHHYAGHGIFGMSFYGILLVLASRLMLPYRK